MTTGRFHRDAITWSGYAGFGLYTYLAASLGPIVPFLTRELSITFTLAGLHATLFAVGTVIAGFLGASLVGALGRSRSYGLAAMGAGAAAVLLALGTSVLMTLVAAALLGASLTVLLAAAQAMLSERHAAQQHIALAEAGVVASLSGSVASFMIGAAQHAGIGWRAALLPALLIAAALVAVSRRAAATGVAATVSARGRLPAKFWWYWWAVLAVVAVEWFVAFWAAQYLVSVVGLTPAQAASAFSFYLLTLFLGRVAGSAAARHTTAPHLLAVSVALVAGGFTLFWTAPAVTFTTAGLLVMGLGVANMYPQSLVLALSAAPQAPDLASNRVILAVGAAILCGPFLLGWIADQLSLRFAFLLVPAALAALLVFASAARRSAVRTGSGA